MAFLRQNLNSQSSMVELLLLQSIFWNKSCLLRGSTSLSLILRWNLLLTLNIMMYLLLELFFYLGGSSQLSSIMLLPTKPITSVFSLLPYPFLVKQTFFFYFGGVNCLSILIFFLVSGFNLFFANKILFVVWDLASLSLDDI